MFCIEFDDVEDLMCVLCLFKKFNVLVVVVSDVLVESLLMKVFDVLIDIVEVLVSIILNLVY